MVQSMKHLITEYSFNEQLKLWSKAFAWNATNKKQYKSNGNHLRVCKMPRSMMASPLITMTPQEAGGVIQTSRHEWGALCD